MICYPEADGNIEDRGETILTVSRGASHKAFPKIEQTAKTSLAGTQNLPWFQGARPNHVRVES